MSHFYSFSGSLKPMRRTFTFVMFLALFAFVSVGCQGGSGGAANLVPNPDESPLNPDESPLNPDPSPDSSPAKPVADATSPSAGATNVPVNIGIQISFSEPMNQALTEAAFSTSPAKSCSFTWNTGSTILNCTPSTELSYATSFNVSVSTGAQSEAGAALEAPISFSFVTMPEPIAPSLPRPMVTASTPSNLATGVSVNQNISVTFSIPMVQDGFLNSVLTNIAIPCSPSWNSDSTVFTCTLTQPLLSATSYIITIDRDVMATNGESLGEDVTFVFGTAGAVSAPVLLVYGGPSPYNTYLGCLNCNEFIQDSVFNQFGTFGPFRNPSMMNQFNTYGSSFSNLSACNTFATDPPRVFDQNGTYYGTLTVNQFAINRIQSPFYLSKLATDICQR